MQGIMPKIGDSYTTLMSLTWLRILMVLETAVFPFCRPVSYLIKTAQHMHPVFLSSTMQTIFTELLSLCKHFVTNGNFSWFQSFVLISMCSLSWGILSKLCKGPKELVVSHLCAQMCYSQSTERLRKAYPKNVSNVKAFSTFFQTSYQFQIHDSWYCLFLTYIIMCNLLSHSSSDLFKQGVWNNLWNCGILKK